MIENQAAEKHGFSFLIWQVIIFAAICWTAMEAPLSFVLDIPAKESHRWWDGILSFLFVCDIVLNIKGFYELKDTPANYSSELKKGKKIISNPSGFLSM